MDKDYNMINVRIVHYKVCSHNKTLRNTYGLY